MEAIFWSVDTLRKQLNYASEAMKLIFPPQPLWATPNKVVLDLPTVRLRKFGIDIGIPTLIDAPYAGHPATVTDYAEGQSLVQTLLNNRIAGVYVTDWKSATYDMRDLGIDDYLDDLARIVDYLGSYVNLIGLCQGGWLAAIYAALYPRRVNSLVMAGAPIDTDAGDGPIRQMVRSYPLGSFAALVQAGGGLMHGDLMLLGWKAMHPEMHLVFKWLDLWNSMDSKIALARGRKFACWYENTLNLPGRFYLQVVDQLFQRNLLFKGRLIAHRRRVLLSDISCPVYLLAGREDDITPPAQVFQAQKLLPQGKSVPAVVAPGGHIGLFMSQNTLNEFWPDIAEWISWNTNSERKRAA
jgi:polyhydroxyalkanoate depolymerase